MAAKSLISLIGECGNSKEVVIAVQEILERVESDFGLEMEDDNEKEDHSKESPADQLISLILLYNAGMISLLHRVFLTTTCQRFLALNCAKSRRRKLSVH